MLTLNAVSDFPKKMVRKAKRWHGSRPQYFHKYGNTLGPAMNERYLAYRRSCQGDAASEPIDSEVRVEGSVLVPGVMPSNTASRLSGRISELLETTDLRSSRPMMKAISSPLSTLGSEVIDIFHAPELKAQIEAFFGCNYRIEWLNCYRSFPTTDVRSSWLWHSDNVPVETLKIMLHLTDAGEEQGATKFMNFADSRAYFDAGYRGDTSHRTDRLDKFAQQRGLPYRPFSHDAKAGDVMVFLNNALHRAVPPVAGYRDVLTYLLLPNPIPWDEQLAIDGHELLQNSPGGYPDFPAARAGSANTRRAA